MIHIKLYIKNHGSIWVHILIHSIDKNKTALSESDAKSL